MGWSKNVNSQIRKVNESAFDTQVLKNAENIFRKPDTTVNSRGMPEGSQARQSASHKRLLKLDMETSNIFTNCAVS